MDFSLRHITDQTFSFNPIAIDIMLYRLLMSFIFSSLIFGLAYLINKRFRKQLDNSFMILMAGPIVCIILLGIGSSVPRAFGLFAALSIIRLRAPIKDTTDMAFIFGSVALGICCGAGAINVALIGIIFFILITALYVSFFLYKKREDYFFAEIISLTNISTELMKTLSSFKVSNLELVNKRFADGKVIMSFFFAAESKVLNELENSLSKDTKIIQMTLEKQVSLNTFN